MGLKWLGFSLYSLFFLISFPVQAGPYQTENKISPWLQNQIKNRNLRSSSTVIIYLKEEADFSNMNKSLPRPQRLKDVFNRLVSTAQKSQARLIAWLNSEKIPFRTYPIANAIAADGISADQIQFLAQREDVIRVVGNPQISHRFPTGLRESSISFRGPGGNIVRFGASQVWNELGAYGQEIIVAGQDTGVKWDHKALKTQYRGWNGSSADHSYSWHDSVHKNTGGNSSCGYDLKSPCDDHNHGTHTVGTMVGDDFEGNQIGVAPKAKWIACRNMDSGLGTPEMYLECFQWFLAPWPQQGDPIQDARPELAPHVINNSWTCPAKEGCDGGEFERVLKALKAAGILVVASAGNDGSDCSTIHEGPAFHSDLVLSVGAINHRNDSIASFSSRGPSTWDNEIGPHVTAPGVNVRSAVKSGGYSESGWSGTSMAGPHLVGLVALLWSADKTLIGNIEKTLELVKKNAEPKTSSQSCGGINGSALPNNIYGFGISNAYQVVKNHLSQAAPH